MQIPATPYRATPEEIGRLRREIRSALAYYKAHGAVPAQPFMKAGTLDRHSWIWLIQRMRPQELKLLEEMCPHQAAQMRKPAIRDGQPRRSRRTPPLDH